LKKLNIEEARDLLLDNFYEPELTEDLNLMDELGKNERFS
jgi:hypothetical protein